MRAVRFGDERASEVGVECLERTDGERGKDSRMLGDNASGGDNLELKVFGHRAGYKRDAHANEGDQQQQPGGLEGEPVRVKDVGQSANFELFYGGDDQLQERFSVLSLLHFMVASS